MFNLIPDTLKQRILKDYKERRIIVLLFVCVLFIVMLFILISPSFGYLFFEEQNVIAEAEVVKKSNQFEKADEVMDVIQSTNEQLRVFMLEISSIQSIEAVEKIVSAKHTGIYIDNIQYKLLTATSSLITVEGKASRRDTLREFVTKLENIEGFTDVVLPVSNFVKDRDIDFTISLKTL